jgi:hypothetical protein
LDRERGLEIQRRRLVESELKQLARERDLHFPIATKAEYVAQMVASHDPVVFRGDTYEVEFAANLIPEMFFPLESEGDLIEKISDLLVARGLSPVPSGNRDD